MDGHMNWSLRVSFDAYANTSLRTQASRRRQLNKTVILHAQHSHPAGHVFQSPIRLKPVHGLAGKTRKVGAGAPGVFRDQGSDQSQFCFAEIATAITHQEVSK